ncbi:MAG: membrane protein insertase YidC [Bradyrhizobiaceae bacterium]|nr:membrane protein insertase YidC [Bradyrhizobiaceae bacterium]
MSEQNNTILAFALSALVLVVWWYFIDMPQQKHREELQRQAQTTQTQQQTQPAPSSPGGSSLPSQSSRIPPPGAAPEPKRREDVVAAAPRVPIQTPSITGSISLKGGRVDDVSLAQYHETVDPTSPAIVLMSPSGSPQPYYAEFGWKPIGGAVKAPGPDTVWTQVGSGSLTPDRPVTLRYDNGEGLEFRRTISIDDKYLFTVRDEVANSGSAAVTLQPYALVSRHGTPPTSGLSLLHEGMIGVMGDQGEQEITYKQIEEKKQQRFDVTNAWMGFTDKYWAAALLPETSARVQAEFSFDMLGTTKAYQTGYLLDRQTIAPGSAGSADARLFAGAKEVSVVGVNFPLANVGGYNRQLGLNKFDLLIDWGRLYFITKPMFLLLDMVNRWIGNFGIAILAVTVLLKLLFFPLANRSYASMAKMKSVQPELQKLRERFPDDKVKQQQEMMEIYKREKINPVAGCLPIVIQIPVFFALYKVLIVTIEMRHAPFFGWIHDLSAPDPTNVFNLFGLFPFEPSQLPFIGHFMVMGAWPLIMGVTMWVQMKLNPAPADPAQKVMFDWMPVIFTFMLAGFSSGLVIYWAWNNTLSVIQQSVIMRRHGAKIELFDNLRGTVRSLTRLLDRLFKKKSSAGGSA